MAAAASVDLDRWQGEFSALMARVGTRFGRVEPRRRVSAFVRGLLAGLPRTNCWSIAEHAGDAQPRGMQRLLSAAVWDETGVRDDLRDYVVERLGDPAAVLVVDETGDVKKGTRTVGVQRQYSGTAGRVENCQVAVYLAYTSASGYAFLDRALYLPRVWTEDQSRMDAAGVPEGVGFATKPALAKRMIDDALAAGAPAAWVAGDEVYGADPDLRRAIAARGVGFVLAVAKSHRFTTGIGDRTAIDIAVRLPRRAWQRLSAGDGAKGPRRYDWAWVTTTDPALTSGNGGQTVTGDGKEWLLIRRTIRTGEHAFYRAHTPGPVSLAALVRVAGARWKVEESFAGGKELAALDEHQVRTWTSWHRWTVLAMLAHAFLSVLTATQPEPDTTTRHPDGLIPLTRNEIRRLLTGLTAAISSAESLLHWSHWRRHHQAVARACHYNRRAELTT